MSKSSSGATASRSSTAVDPTNDDGNGEARDDKKQGATDKKGPSWKEEQLDAINERMRLHEENLATSKGKVLRLQNRVSSLENTILTGIQEKTKLLAEDYNNNSNSCEAKQSAELQGKLKTLNDSLKKNEEELATSKTELSRLQDGVMSLEYKIISLIQEKARINLMADDDDDEQHHKDGAKVKKSPASAAKRQKVA
eukprot:jgi/Psemu1/284507/fgenesh1_pg.56_\